VFEEALKSEKSKDPYFLGTTALSFGFFVDEALRGG
jgi:hypothetical protein